jgi:hypothetical protein
MTLIESLQLLNLLIVPALVYVVRLEKRIYALELVLKLRIEQLACVRAATCNQSEAMP